ncbi:MAG: hypothetical protein V4699_02835 [Patescibacteria group bacterium]
MEEITKQISLYQARIGIDINPLAEEIRIITSKVVSDSIIMSRIKHPLILKKKMQLFNVTDIFLIDDVYGIRVIVDKVEQAYEVLNEISQVLCGDIILDYFKEPKKVSGKTTIQFLKFVAFINNTAFEIQITTKGRHKINEVQHKEYHDIKYSKLNL